MTDEKGFILPIVMMIDFLLIAFVIQAVILLNSDRHFFQSYMTAFQFQQLRNSAVADIRDLAGKKTLPASGTFIYDLGKAEYETNASGQTVTIHLTLTSGGQTESDQFDYGMNKGGIIKWREKI